MLNSGNNDREQNWLLLSPMVKRAKSDWRATVTLGCPRCFLQDLSKIKHCLYRRPADFSYEKPMWYRELRVWCMMYKFDNILGQELTENNIRTFLYVEPLTYMYTQNKWLNWINCAFCSGRASWMSPGFRCGDVSSLVSRRTRNRVIDRPELKVDDPVPLLLPFGTFIACFDQKRLFNDV
jgi:hypothetical protein